MEDNTLEVRVRDFGSGVKNPKPHKPDMERKLHGEEEARGMGMFLIQSLVDEAEWVRNGSEDSYTLRSKPQTTLSLQVRGAHRRFHND